MKRRSFLEFLTGATLIAPGVKILFRPRAPEPPGTPDPAQLSTAGGLKELPTGFLIYDTAGGRFWKWDGQQWADTENAPTTPNFRA